jgi:putative tryptophan/tyrosine transport system substrate-binding protein
MIKRREFIAGLGVVAAWPLAARAQQPALPLIGFASPGTPERSTLNMAAFLRGLADTGYVEGRNVAIEYRWAGDRNDRLADLAIELIRRQVAVIVLPGSTANALAAKAATQTVPVVFLIGTNPVELGLVASLARPGGNMTGITLLANELYAKQLELLHECVPAATSIAVLVNPTNFANGIAVTVVQAAARALGTGLLVLNASNQSEIEAAFLTLAQQRAGGLMVLGDPFLLAQRSQIVGLAARNAVPAIYVFREEVEAGGLMSYGTDIVDASRRVGVYAGRILKGRSLPISRYSRRRKSN